MEWSNELILEFFDLYEQEPCIWNPKHSLHKVRNSVHDSWKNIAQNLSVQYSISDLKKKKDLLMATFRKLNNKVKASKKLVRVWMTSTNLTGLRMNQWPSLEQQKL